MKTVKKYFVNFDVNRQEEMTNAKDVVQLLRAIDSGNRPGDLGSTKVEVGRLERGEWTSEKFIGGHEFLAGIR